MKNTTIERVLIGSVMAITIGAVYFAVHPLASGSPDPLAPACTNYEFTPQKDITAFETAFIYKNTSGYSHQVLCISDKDWGLIDAKLKRHFTKITVTPSTTTNVPGQ